jgi:hypothetical protein
MRACSQTADSSSALPSSPFNLSRTLGSVMGLPRNQEVTDLWFDPDRRALVGVRLGVAADEVGHGSLLEGKGGST